MQVRPNSPVAMFQLCSTAATSVMVVLAANTPPKLATTASGADINWAFGASQGPNIAATVVAIVTETAEGTTNIR
jgi:hypothetical protein